MATRCLPSLIKKLSCRHTMEPFRVLDLYEGNDLKSIDSLYPISLWKNDYMELYVRNWNPNENFLYRNNYSTVHTKVLNGCFVSRTKQEKVEFIKKNEKYTFHPFSNVLFTSMEKSSTIQLYYYHHMY